MPASVDKEARARLWRRCYLCLSTGRLPSPRARFRLLKSGGALPALADIVGEDVCLGC